MTKTFHSFSLQYVVGSPRSRETKTKYPGYWEEFQDIYGTQSEGNPCRQVGKFNTDIERVYRSILTTSKTRIPTSYYHSLESQKYMMYL